MPAQEPTGASDKSETQWVSNRIKGESLASAGISGILSILFGEWCGGLHER